MKMLVIDISKHNGAIDFNKVKAAGVEGVIIRAGYGKVSSQKDPNFETNYKKATEAGLHVGAYWYSYAATDFEAVQEAVCFADAIKGKRFDLPVYLDIEEQASQKNAPQIVGAFCSYMESLGYFVGVYASKSYIETYLKGAEKPYTVWVAQWGVNACTYPGTVDMWQYSSTGTVDGISGNVDLDYCYKDFPTIIHKAGKNGYCSDDYIPPQELLDTEDIDFINECRKRHEIAVLIDGKTVWKGEFGGN